MNREKLSRSYATFSMLISNTVCFVIVINVVLAAFFFIRDRTKQQSHEKERMALLTGRPGQPKLAENRTDYELKWIDLRAYEDEDPQKVDQMLGDFYDHERQGYRYSPYLLYSNSPFSSATLNIVVDQKGVDYRKTVDPKPSTAAPPFRVFMMGGSTTFGTHVADDWTVPAYFEKALQGVADEKKLGLQVQVTNFGRANYSWFQELVLLQRLLHFGYRPDLVVFLDGVNAFETQGIPVWSDRARELWEKEQLFAQNFYLPDSIPMFRLINYQTRKQRETKLSEVIAARYPDRNPATEDFGSAMRMSYENTLAQTKSLASTFKFRLHFVLQPNRAFQCNLIPHERPLPESYVLDIQRFYSEALKVKDSSFLPLTHICNEFGDKHRAFVDDVHYSPLFAQFLANHLAQSIGL